MFKKLLYSTKAQFISLIIILTLIIGAVTVFLFYNLKLTDTAGAFKNNLLHFTFKTFQYKEAITEFKEAEHKNDLFELRKDKYSEAVFILNEELKKINEDLKKFSKAEKYELLPVISQNENVLNESFDNFILFL